MKTPKHFAKAKKIAMDKDELVREHKHLVGVLRSPSHKDDKVEAKKQAKELQEYTKKSEDDVSTRKPSDKQLADKIITHNKKKLHNFAKKHIKKSVDFKDTSVSVDAQDQLLAEKTTSPALIEYITNNLGVLKSGPGASVKIPFPTGMLTMSEREAGVYHGHFQDRDGQIIEKFDSQTVALIAKTLQLKSMVPTPTEPQAVPIAAPQEAPSTSDIAMAAHNRIDDLQRQIIDQVKGRSIRIKYGDFELEIRKSVQDFVGDFKAGRMSTDKDVVRKAISSWRKKHSEYRNISSDQAAARELMENWEQHQDSFCQFVDALSREDDE